jgi:hypothetical protein
MLLAEEDMTQNTATIAALLKPLRRASYPSAAGRYSYSPFNSHCKIVRRETGIAPQNAAEIRE